MNAADIATVQSILSQPQNIVLVPHKNPDGDALGACLALYAFLKEKGQQVSVITPNAYPKFLQWMPYSTEVLNYEWDNREAQKRLEAATVVFTVDFNDLARTGPMEAILRESRADFIMIDHHQQPENYARVTYSNTAMSSTCEMVYTFIVHLGEREQITKAIATNLYVGIMTDTGSFKYPSTSSQTHRVVAELIDCGANAMDIHRQVYDTHAPSRLQLLSTALRNMVVLPEMRTAYITLTQEELDAHDCKKGDTEGFVNYGLTLEGIVFAVIFIENREEGIIKISFRSVGDFSVNAFARNHFSGGGHDNAAGGKSDLSMEETVQQFRTLLPSYKSALHL